MRRNPKCDQNYLIVWPHLQASQTACSCLVSHRLHYVYSQIHSVSFCSSVAEGPALFSASGLWMVLFSSNYTVFVCTGCAATILS